MQSQTIITLNVETLVVKEIVEKKYEKEYRIQNNELFGQQINH